MMSLKSQCRGIPLRLILAGLIIMQLFFIWAVVRSRQSYFDRKLLGADGQRVNSLTAVTYSDTLTEQVVTKSIVKKTTKKPVIIDMVNDYQPFVDFRFVFPHIIPTIKGSRDFFLIILVNSAAKGKEYRERRDNIRRTWGSLNGCCEQMKAMNNSKIKNLKWKLVFVLGKAGPGTDDDKLNAEEAKRYNDILIGHIDDNYLNNIIKVYMGQLWASTFTAKFTLKADDDVYVRIPGIIEYLVSENITDNFYGGETYPTTGVARWAGGKWSISKKYFPEDVWPPFNAGAFYILSTNLLERLFNYIHIRKPFHTDDAYVGVAMRDLKVNVTHILSFDIKNDMAQLIRKKNNCEILALIAFGHSIDPESSKILHNKLESMCSKNITKTSC